MDKRNNIKKIIINQIIMSQQIKLMHGKLHRIKVTSSNLHYVGSITIDQNLLEAVGILPLEEVEIVNLNNGERWSTYVLPGEAGKGEVCPNGGGAYLCNAGDLLIIYAYNYVDRKEVMQKGHKARVMIANKDNQCEDLLLQELCNNESGQTYHSYSIKPEFDTA